MGLPDPSQSPATPIDRTRRGRSSDPRIDHVRLGLSVGVVAAAAFSRSLEMWTANAWDISSPLKILALGTAVAVIGVALLLLLARMGSSPVPTSLSMASLILVLVNWQSLEGSTRPLLILLISVFGWLSQRTIATDWVWLAIIFAAAFGVAPIFQVAASHIEESEPYPLVERRTPQPAAASGVIEDVVVVVVDSYPNLHIAESWFGHDTGPLTDDLELLGFTVEPGAWSQHTFTSLSVPSILEVQSVIEGGPVGPWRNRSSLYRISRGENFTAQTLQSAGFRYTHVESGWDGTTCGAQVDHCVQAPFFDDQTWEAMAPTIARSWLNDSYFTVSGTFNTADALDRELDAVVSNGTHDFVFAHFLLPHDPILVDASCANSSDEARQQVDTATVRAAFSDQMSCVDRLLIAVLRTVDADTAVLVTGDHGPATRGQLGRTPGKWSDADIAERFSVLLAHKLPDVCPPPVRPDPMAAMAAILGCAVGADFVIPGPDYLISAHDATDPVAIDPERMARIQELVATGSLPSDSG